MWRYLFHRFASEKFIEYLSQTYVIRRAAQITVATYYRFSGDKRLQNVFKSGRTQRIYDSFKQNIKKDLEDVQRELKKGPKK